jgi:hypothetical protein
MAKPDDDDYIELGTQTASSTRLGSSAELLDAPGHVCLDFMSHIAPDVQLLLLYIVTCF